MMGPFTKIKKTEKRVNLGKETKSSVFEIIVYELFMR